MRVGKFGADPRHTVRGPFAIPRAVHSIPRFKRFRSPQQKRFSVRDPYVLKYARSLIGQHPLILHRQ
jgi:hypothetical protein